MLCKHEYIKWKKTIQESVHTILIKKQVRAYELELLSSFINV